MVSGAAILTLLVTPDVKRFAAAARSGGMAGRIKRKAGLAAAEALVARTAAPPAPCALCGRPLGARIEWHHVVPKSEGGRETQPVHPICHRTIHAAAPNAELARLGTIEAVRALPPIARFLAWIADKPPDFHAPTRRLRPDEADWRRARGRR